MYTPTHTVLHTTQAPRVKINVKNLTCDNLQKKKDHISRLSRWMCKEVQSKAQNIIYPYLPVTGKNLVTHTPLMSIHALTPKLHKK